MARGIPPKLAAALELCWSGWRSKRKSYGLTEHKFVLDFPVQRHWDWRVAFYLYLAGTSAGFIFLELVLRWMNVIKETTAVWGMWLGLALALLSLAVLFDHLGPVSRWNFHYAFRRPRSSWISRGAIIVTLLVILRLVLLLPSISGFDSLPWVEGSLASDILRAMVLLLALAFMAYSGLVLSSWNAIAFWNTPMLPALYIGYSFLGGIAALPVIALIVEGTEGMKALGTDLWPFLLALLLWNGLFLLLYVYGMSRATLPARESVRRLMHGALGWSFWIGVVGIGLILPTAIIALEMSNLLGSGNSDASILLVASVATLAGGYLLRDNILRVGVYGSPV